MLTVITALFKMEENASKKRAQHAGKQPRPSRTHPKKAEVLNYWHQWQKNPSLYPNKIAFIRDMQEKMEIERTETVRAWINHAEKARA